MPDIKPIKDIDGYFVSKNGDVYSKKGNLLKKLKPYVNRSGYYIISIRRHTRILHRLIAKAWIPNPNILPEVNHKNGIKTDNRIENLEWCSRLDNARHSWKFLGRKSPMLGRVGIKSPYSKVIRQIKDGVVIKEYYGACEAERETGVKRQNILSCCHGKTKSAGGYVWKIKE